MPEFGKTSRERLNGVNARLRTLCNEVVKLRDCSILSGLRTIEEQSELYKSGKSRTMNSKHLTGNAVDLAPYPIDWGDTKRFHYFAGIVIGMAHEMGIKIRWGGDWDSDGDSNDQKFNDLVHFELVD